MRKSCFFILVSISPLVWTGCNTMQGPSLNANPAPQRMAASSSSIDSRQVEIANLRADVQNMDRRVREMTIGMEELARQNQELSAQLERLQRSQAGQMGDVVRQPQLTQAINDLQGKTQTANAELRRQIVREVTQQIEQLGKQTQAAIDAVARNASAARPSTPVAQRQATFSEDFPREGVSYTVESGDNLSRIAARHNSTVRDIQNANQIADPTTIKPGQTLFIPQRQN